jgi:acyl-ACP thioesterase
VTPAARLRFDALARYLQEAAEDDLADAGWDEPSGWLLRRVAIAARGYPARGDHVGLRTFCSATGPRWAERTTTLAGPGGDLIQARAVWVAIARADGRPAPLGAQFQRLYGEAAQGRRVSARLSLPGPSASQPGRPWPLRATNFDTAGHVNNSVHWAAVEDVLAGLGARLAAGQRRTRILPPHPARPRPRHSHRALARSSRCLAPRRHPAAGVGPADPLTGWLPFSPTDRAWPAASRPPPAWPGPGPRRTRAASGW